METHSHSSRSDRVSPLAISAETGSRDAVGLHCRENAVRSRHGNRKIAGTEFERYGRVTGLNSNFSPLINAPNLVASESGSSLLGSVRQHRFDALTGGNEKEQNNVEAAPAFPIDPLRRLPAPGPCGATPPNLHWPAG